MPRLPWQASLLLLALIWGCSFWWVEEALVAFTPLQLAFVRCAIGAVVLLTIVVVTRTPLPPRALWKHLVVVALLINGVSITLFALGQTQVSSILAAIINATAPLWTLAVTLTVFRDESPTRQRIMGLVVGFVGVLILLGVWQSIPQGQLLGVAACLVAALSYAIALPYSHRHVTSTATSPLSLGAVQVAIGSLILLPVMGVEAAAGGMSGISLSPAPILAILGLGALGSGIAYVLNFSVIRTAGSSTAATVTYLIPIVAVAVGTTILREPMTWYEPVGAAVVLLGIAISQGRVRLRQAGPSPGSRSDR